ncbi:MAG: ATP-binding protein [Anaerolineae bacterium]
MEQRPQRRSRRFRELLEIIQLAENISVKLYDALDEATVFQTVVDEFAQSQKYSGSILLLTEDRSKLRMAATSLFSSPAYGPVIEHIAGIQLLGYELDPAQSDVWRPVLQEGRTVHYHAAQVVRQLFPQPIAEHIIEAMDYGRKSYILTPLKRQGQIIGILAMAMVGLTEHLIPSVTNLALHISHALDLIETKRGEMQAMQALQESQVTMQSLINASPEVIVLLDREGKVLTGNSALAKSLGYPLNELLGQNVLQFFPPGVRENREAQMRRVLEEGKPVYFQDERDGRHFEHFLYPVFGTAGQVERIAVFARDITERRKMEAELLQKEKLAALGLLSEGVAHGLRNPLAVISSCVHMLLAHPDNAQLCFESAQRIESALRRAASITDALLQFAHAPAGPLSVLDLAPVLRTTLELLIDHLLMHKVSVRRRWPSNLPMIYGNARLLQQVFTELILNACDAMPNGGTITITARALRADWVEVCFRDTGWGIAPEHLSKIFDPFFTTKPKGESIGLGLSLAQRIVQQQGGNIEVQSQLGKGTCFTVRLRRAAEEV